jgi:hypothetical protein
MAAAFAGYDAKGASEVADGDFDGGRVVLFGERVEL